MEIYDYLNGDYQNEERSTFICLPSTNFGYGYPTFNAGFIYIQNEESGNQEIRN